MKTYKCAGCGYEPPRVQENPEAQFYSNRYLVDGSFLEIHFCHACVRDALEGAHRDKIAGMLDKCVAAFQKKREDRQKIEEVSRKV